ncbi:hypothetical protein HPB49_010066 [Dermacentor silvarum]|uniref:Uncharacterized protein n=1 Tax=Dermacentor silvarum TaxID=543639 RepID=A0ACB8DZV0_DERSI|nr:hypothetical protein HPB49_010066 [Dermacentor silvarum]
MENSARAAIGWTGAFSQCKVTIDDVWRYLHSSTHNVRQAHRGWALKEEDYIRNAMMNLKNRRFALWARSSGMLTIYEERPAVSSHNSVARSTHVREDRRNVIRVLHEVRRPA